MKLRPPKRQTRRLRLRLDKRPLCNNAPFATIPPSDFPLQHSTANPEPWFVCCNNRSSQTTTRNIAIMWTINPFKKHDASEFEGVLVRLDQEPKGSQRDGSSTTTTQGEKVVSDEKSSHRDSDDRSGAPSIRAGTSVGLTLGQLRASIEDDVDAGETQSAYDRKFCHL